MARWPSGKAEVCKTSIAGSIPALASLIFTHPGCRAASGVQIGGSFPTPDVGSITA